MSLRRSPTQSPTCISVDQLDAKYEANKRATEWLEERLSELRRALQTSEEQVAAYRRDKGLLGSSRRYGFHPDSDRIEW